MYVCSEAAKIEYFKMLVCFFGFLVLYKIQHSFLSKSFEQKKKLGFWIKNHLKILGYQKLVVSL